MDEPAYVARLESADADELARVITSAAGDEERVLREYLGDDRFHYMRELALRSTGVTVQAAERGNVVVPKVEQEIVRIYAQARNRGCNPKQRYSVASRCWRACSPSDSRH
jgi:hypothetical protein